MQFAICNSRKGSGFTLIEILLVLSIVGIMLSVTLPVSYSMYQRYQSSLKAEDVLVLLSSLRRESFLYGEEKLVHSENGRLFINNESKDFKDVFVQIDRPVKFYKNGTTSGGEVKIYVKDYTFLIDIESPFGALILRTV
ncbi:MAG: type II secretion system protein [Nitrospirae bacterium]|nr:type II secretion system protein [Nitrospirota bacterium]